MNKKLMSSLLLPILCLTSSANATNVTPKETSNKSVVETKSQNKVFEKVKNFVKSPIGKKSLYIGLPTLGVIGVCIVAGIVNKKKKQHDPHEELEKTNMVENNDQNEKTDENSVKLNKSNPNLSKINIHEANEKEKIIEIKKDEIENNMDSTQGIIDMKIENKDKKAENTIIIKESNNKNGKISKKQVKQKQSLKKVQTSADEQAYIFEKYNFGLFGS